MLLRFLRSPLVKIKFLGSTCGSRFLLGEVTTKGLKGQAVALATPDVYFIWSHLITAANSGRRGAVAEIRGSGSNWIMSGVIHLRIKNGSSIT
ncbi:hypothetical protein AVEN_259452-1 [Araneus ventricosus]|uniref:Uncharacterized protein n=1 Tax=Araneus ventricosus TaxID=182803 RepID=A0A4Y2MJB7_ARAVE|nr:hypothetical protein AVEN_259452-1 [Araneus ventricosus]